MKKLTLLIAVLISITSFAQSNSGDLKRYPGVWIQYRDTASATAADTLCLFIQPVTAKLYYHGRPGTPWLDFGTSTGAGFINNALGINTIQSAGIKVTDSIKTSGNITAATANITGVTTSGVFSGSGLSITGLPQITNAGPSHIVFNNTDKLKYGGRGNGTARVSVGGDGFFEWNGNYNMRYVDIPGIGPVHLQYDPTIGSAWIGFNDEEFGLQWAKTFASPPVPDTLDVWQRSGRPFAFHSYLTTGKFSINTNTATNTSFAMFHIRNNPNTISIGGSTVGGSDTLRINGSKDRNVSAPLYLQDSTNTGDVNISGGGGLTNIGGDLNITGTVSASELSVTKLNTYPSGSDPGVTVTNASSINSIYPHGIIASPLNSNRVSVSVSNAPSTGTYVAVYTNINSVNIDTNRVSFLQAASGTPWTGSLLPTTMTGSRQWLLQDVSGTIAHSGDPLLTTGTIQGSNITATGSISASNLSSTVYTAVITLGANAASATPFLSHYKRVGNEVFVQGGVTVVATLGANTTTTILISLPFGSDFTRFDDCLGQGSPAQLNGQNVIIAANTTSNLASLNYLSTAASGSTDIYYSFSYTIK